MRAMILIFLSCLLLSGCFRGFVKDGATYQDFYKDLRECELEIAPYKSTIRKQRNQCMLNREWHLTREGDRFLP